MKRKKTRNSIKLLFENLTYQIIGACLNAYKEMDCDFLESIYTVDSKMNKFLWISVCSVVYKY